MKIKLFLITLLTTLSISTKAALWYVNINSGDDNFDGSSALFLSGITGPKKTISNAISNAGINDTIYISEGIYAELLLIDKALVLRGNNWGINPLTQLRNSETIIVPPNISLGTSISGNSIIEIASCCIEIDGIKIMGDNINTNVAPSKYNLQHEISYGIGGTGAFFNLHFTNLTISQFGISGISLSSGLFSTHSNKIDFCKILTGEQNSEGITLIDNFYCDINFTTIDSTNKGLSLINFSDKTNKQVGYSYLNIKSETSGISLINFTGNTDSLLFQYNIINPFDPNYVFSGFVLNDISSKGHINISNNIVNNATYGISINNYFDKITSIYSDNKFSGGKIGINLEQSIITPSLDITFSRSLFENLDSSAIVSNVNGDLLTINLIDIKISKSGNGLLLFGNSTSNTNNTQFDKIKNYYIFLDSSSTGLRPINNIDATSCSYENVLGNNLNKEEAFLVEDKIRHNLDRNKNGLIIFKDKNLFVSTNDGNYSLNQAVLKANSDWNIFLDSISSNETVNIDKTLHLYTHKACGIGKIKMISKDQILYLHGNLYLSEGIELIEGFIETSQFDTLIVYRNSMNTVLNSGNKLSFVRGPLYIRYINLPENYTIIDTIPSGLGDDYRPFYINSTWPAGIIFFDAGFKSYNGKMPLLNLPSDISNISDIRYWQIFNPHNKPSFTINKVGFVYDTLVINDLANDPSNLRIVFRDISTINNLGGSGNFANSGSIWSDKGNPGFGFYALGNADGGNNILSSDKPIANITVVGNCTNDSITFSAINSRSDSTINFWEWSINGPSAVVTSENIETIKKSITVAGSYNIRLIISNTKGFLDTATKSFVIDAIPSISYSAKSPCYPANIEIKNNSTLPPLTTISETEWKIGTSYFYTSDLIYTPAISGTQAGRLKITLNTGCSDTLPILINSPAKPTLNLIPNGLVEICSGEKKIIKINKSPGIITWNDNQTYDSLILSTNTFKKATLYSSVECFSSDSVSIKLLEKPSVNAGPNFTTLPGKPVNIKGSSNAMVEWLPDTWLNDGSISNPISRPLITTQYILRAYNTQGCENTDTMIVFVNTENSSNVPNLLTPNGDGHNDTWKLSNIDDPENCSVYVFTREGQIVFSTSSYNGNWDGTRDSMVLPDGYYVFVIEHKTMNKVYTGILNIIK